MNAITALCELIQIFFGGPLTKCLSGDALRLCVVSFKTEKTDFNTQPVGIDKTCRPYTNPETTAKHDPKNVH